MVQQYPSASVYFNPLPPCGGRPPPSSFYYTTKYFNPLPPCGGRQCKPFCTSDNAHFNPLPPCGGRQKAEQHEYMLTGISIHSLRVEGDEGIILEGLLESIFQSTPSVWRETQKRLYVAKIAAFQSTPSVWRETTSHRTARRYAAFQSTPSVWRETLKISLFVV